MRANAPRAVTSLLVAVILSVALSATGAVAKPTEKVWHKSFEAGFSEPFPGSIGAHRGVVAWHVDSYQDPFHTDETWVWIFRVGCEQYSTTPAADFDWGKRKAVLDFVSPTCGPVHVEWTASGPTEYTQTKGWVNGNNCSGSAAHRKDKHWMTPARVVGSIGPGPSMPAKFTIFDGEGAIHKRIITSTICE